MVTTNVGWRDAGIRAFVGGLLLFVSASLHVRPLLAVAAGFIALLFLGTALFRVCPIYAAFGVRTNAHDAESH